MTGKQLRALFNTHGDEYGKFEKVEPKRSRRRDLHAFMLLDELLPGDGQVLLSSEHDEVYLGFDDDELAAVITEEQVLELVRCGVRHDGSGLCMFV